jgi:tRNA U34 5-carboxymethylaminomethyl modifying GTPase MnmE/TrmE
MKINRDFLLKLVTVKPVTKPVGVGEAIRGIHKTLGLREWVTMESVALAPVPVNRNGYWGILSLLAVPTQLADNSPGWLAPWGAIEWSFPELEVVQKIDLRHLPEMRSIRRSDSFPSHPVDRQSGDLGSRTQRENALFQALDLLLSTPPSNSINLDVLAHHYAGLLAAEIYPYYHTLIPDSQEWLLHDDAKAFHLPTSEPSVSLQQIAKPPVDRSEHPTDLTEQIDPWLHQSLVLAESQQLNEIVSEFHHLTQRWHLPGFRLAIVGEFNRGKSTFVNRLLDRSLVPTDLLPATAVLTSMIAGVEESMEVSFSPQSKELRPLEPASWGDLCITDSTGQERDVRASVQLTLDDAWLRSLDLELIDTPGMGDLNQQREQLLLDLLNQCDAVVMVVSAIAPISMTETAFLKQQLLGRHLNRITIVVSHLDTIAMEQRHRLLAHIQGKVAEISDSISILPLHPIDGETTEVEVLQTVKTEVAAMVSKSERRAWRSQQIARQILDLLNHSIQIGQNAISAGKINPEQQRQVLEQIQQQTKAAELHWQKIKGELNKRQEQCYQQLQQKVFEHKNDLMEQLLLELDRTQNPKFWWERELSLRLRREFTALGRKLEDVLLKSISRDSEWLKKEVSQFSSLLNIGNISQYSASKSESLGINYQPNQLELFDLQNYRLLTRMGGSAAMIGGYVFGGPIGILASLGTTVLGDRILSSKLEEQRRIIAEELQPSIERATNQYCQSISERLSNLYHQIHLIR